MFDFKLTPKGDILLYGNTSISSFSLSFSISKYKGQRVSFYTSEQNSTPSQYPQTVSFYIQKPQERSMSEKDVSDDQEKMQAARIELKTEQKNVYNYEAGSTFYKLNHTVYKEIANNSTIGICNSITIDHSLPTGYTLKVVTSVEMLQFNNVDWSFTNTFTA